MSNFNKVVIIGNLTREPEYKQFSSGGVTRLGLASNRQYKNKNTGALVQEVCFIDVDVFGPQAESCRQYLQKGRPVLIEGRLKLDTWQAADGQARSKHTIVAERVVFLQAGAPAAAFGEAEITSASEQSLHESGGEQELKPAQRDFQPKAPVGRAKKAESLAGKDSEESTSDFNFKDEPPFSDELPF